MVHFCSYNEMQSIILRRLGCFSSFPGFGCPSLSVVSSNPRTACWAPCVELNAERQDPCLYTTPAGPQLGTPSAYNLKIHGTDGPEMQTRQTISLQNFSIWVHLGRILIVWWKEVTHPVGLIHRLVVETCTDDVKWRHGDCHSDSTDHGSYQGRETAVWTKPLQGEEKKLITNRGLTFEWWSDSNCLVFTSWKNVSCVFFHTYLRMWHPVLGRGEGCQLSSWANHDSRHGPVYTPPKAN